MPLFRKKPVTIEAHQMPPENQDASEELIEFLRDADGMSGHGGTFEIHTLEGTMVAKPGDWVIKGVKGEYYPCKPEIFEATYEPV